MTTTGAAFYSAWLHLLLLLRLLLRLLELYRVCYVSGVDVCLGASGSWYSTWCILVVQHGAYFYVRMTPGMDGTVHEGCTTW